MRSSRKKFISLLLVIVALFSFSACEKNDTPALWENATYTEDAVLGQGAKTLVVKVEVGEKTVAFTLKTDKETVGEALLEHSLIAGDESEYGLYIKEVNGIKADFDTDGAYWSFNKNGEYMMTGVDSTNFTDGEQYELVYTKG